MTAPSAGPCEAVREHLGDRGDWNNATPQAQSERPCRFGCRFCGLPLRPSDTRWGAKFEGGTATTTTPSVSPGRAFTTSICTRGTGWTLERTIATNFSGAPASWTLQISVASSVGLSSSLRIGGRRLRPSSPRHLCLLPEPSRSREVRAPSRASSSQFVQGATLTSAQVRGIHMRGIVVLAM